MVGEVEGGPGGSPERKVAAGIGTSFEARVGNINQGEEGDGNEGGVELLDLHFDCRSITASIE